MEEIPFGATDGAKRLWACGPNRLTRGAVSNGFSPLSRELEVLKRRSRAELFPPFGGAISYRRRALAPSFPAWKLHEAASFHSTPHSEMAGDERWVAAEKEVKVGRSTDNRLLVMQMKPLSRQGHTVMKSEQSDKALNFKNCIAACF